MRIDPGWYLLDSRDLDITAIAPLGLNWVEVVDCGQTVYSVPFEHMEAASRGIVISIAVAECVVHIRTQSGDLIRIEHLIRPMSRKAVALRLYAGVLRHGSLRRIVRMSVDVIADVICNLGAGAGALLNAHYVLSATDRYCFSWDIPIEVNVGRRQVHVARLRSINGLQSKQDSDEEVRRRTVDANASFMLESTWDGMPLGAGWYRFSVKLCERIGQVAMPALYLDHGDGCLQANMVALPKPDTDGWIDAVVMFGYPVWRIHFDPSIRQCALSLGTARLQRIGRPQALVLMLLGKRRSNLIDWLGALERSVDFVRTALRHGARVAAAALYAPSGHAVSSSRQQYEAWVRRYDEFDSNELEALRQRAQALTDGPLISVIVPVYETPECWLRRCIESVCQQAYTRWELCLADDASSSPHVRRVLEEYAARDQRIRVVYRDSNGHICRASNSALEIATGDWVALLDHDDELRPHALLRVAEEIVARPSIDLVYSDEDKIDETGNRFDPNFKPDWNPDLLRSQNYVCHLMVIRTHLIQKVGGFRPGFEGSQDHDLVLRCAERLSTDKIYHIPEILYHWRAIVGSTALSRNEKDYTGLAGERAVREHLARIGADAGVELLPCGHFRIRWYVPVPLPLVSIVIPTRDQGSLLRCCIDSILEKTIYPNFEILVIDNQSVEDETLRYFAELADEPRVRILGYDAPFNYSAINNFAVANCAGTVVALVNNDVEVIDAGWLEEMVGLCMREDVGAVGCMLLYPDNRIQHAGVVLGVQGVANHFYQHLPHGYPGHGARALVTQNLSAVTAACLLVKRSAYTEVGGLDERLTVAFNDVDFCLRLEELGYRNVWTPFAVLYHHESATRGAEDSPDKMARFQGEISHMLDRWGERLRNDPAYNPNLTLEGVDSGLASPPRGRTAILRD